MAENFENLAEVVGRRGASIEAWIRQCSERLTHIELRAMSQNPLAHELMRHFMSTLSAWRPTVDLSWGYRALEDWAQKGVRTLVSVYKSNEVPIMSTLEQASIVVRVIFEEAVHRTFLSYDGNDELMRAMSALLLTVRNIEAAKKNPEDFMKIGLFVTMTEANLQYMSKAVAEQTMKIEALPSWHLVAEDSNPMRSELYALVHVSPQELRIGGCGLSPDVVSWAYVFICIWRSWCRILMKT